MRPTELVGRIGDDAGDPGRRRALEQEIDAALVLVGEAAKDERFVARQAKSWGPALVFGRLWERQSVAEMLGRLAAGRRFGFDPERVAFALALQRLCAPGSDLQGAAWAQTVEAPGFEDLALHHFYRTVPWLAAIRYELERELFFQDRDLFAGELDLVFVDTTSVYLYRAAESALVRHGGLQVLVAGRARLPHPQVDSRRPPDLPPAR